MIFYTGDLHGNFDIHKLNVNNFKEQKMLTKKDFLIIAGDFGLIFSNPKSQFYPTEKNWLDWLNDRNFTTLVVLGNHENYDIIESGIFETIPMFEGTVKKIHNSIFILERGQIYNIDGKRHFVFGGAASIDKHRRVEHITWWPQEIPTYKEEMFGLGNLKKENNKVDVIVTHATHQKMFDALNLSCSLEEKRNDPLLTYLTEVQKRTSYKFWVNGHYHMDKMDVESKTITMYYSILDYDTLEQRFKK